MLRRMALRPISLDWASWAKRNSYIAQRDPDDTSVGSSSLSPAAVGGITAGGVVGLFIILVLIARFTAQKRHGDEKDDRHLSAFSVDDDVRQAIHAAHPPALDLSHRTHPYPNYPARKLSSVTDIWLDDPTRDPERSNSKLIRPSKAFFRYSRDSWPLISWAKSPTTPVSVTHPSNHALGESIIRPSSSPTVHKSPEMPAIPTRSYSQPGLSTELSLGFERGALANTMGRVGRESMRPTHQKQTSISDNQLTSILRSTSQRLRDRDAIKNSRPLSRAMSSLSHTSGAPPTQKLPSPPRAKNTESREGLMAEYKLNRPESAASNVESISGSLFDLYPIERTPSPEKDMPWSADDLRGRPVSPAQSNISDDDSISRGKTPDLIPIIALLSSPSKKVPSPPRRVSHGSNEGATMIHKDNRASLGGHDNLWPPRNQSLNRTNGREPTDPFYANGPGLIGPREAPRTTYNRKANSGEHSKPPLSMVSGNNAAHPAAPREKPAPPNPFQWSPEEARRQKPLQVAPKQPVRRGHKRQNVVRMSGLPRPPSVTVIPEQPEEMTPDRLTKSTPDLAPPLSKFNENTESPTSVYSRYTLTRPPSIQDFDPALSLPDLSARLGHQAVFPLPPYSSTLSIYNYYSSPEGNKSDEDFFSTTSPNRTPSQAKRRHGRDFSIEKFVFNPPAVDETRPGTATGSHSQTATEALKSRDSIQASIGILRRMNSEVSSYSQDSSRNSIDSTTAQEYLGGAGISPSKRSNRGSKNYLAIGGSARPSLSPSPARKKIRSRGSEAEGSPTRSHHKHSLSGQGLGKRDSSDLSASRRNSGLGIRGLPDIPVKDKRRSLRSEETAELLRLYTSTHPSNLQGWETPVVDKGIWDGQEVAQKVDNDRWEQTEQAVLEGVRHESQLKMPSPQGKIEWNGLRGEGFGRPGTRGSLGYYDEEGFLRGSPGREGRM